MLGTQRSPLPSPPLEPPFPLLLTSSSGADHPSPALRTPSSVSFPCSCLLLPQISGIDCALDSSGPVRQTRHMSWRAAASTSAVVRDRDRRPGCAVRGADGALEIAVRVNATGKVRLFPSTRRGAGEGERGKKTARPASKSAAARSQLRRRPNDTAQSNIRFCCSTVHRNRVPDSLCPSPP